MRQVDSYLRNKTFVEKDGAISFQSPLYTKECYFSTLYLFLFVFSNEKKMSRHIIIRIDVWDYEVVTSLQAGRGAKKIKDP